MTVTWKKLSFQKAIDFFRRKINLPSEDYQDIWREAHEWAFMIAGITKAEMLQDFKTVILNALEKGTTLEDFRKQFDRIVASNSWQYNGSRNWRSQVIFSTNIRVAYAAGRYKQQTEPEMLTRRPFWEWRHGDSFKPRDLHLKWDGMILRADDPWWETHYPPCAWGCRCRVFALSQSDLNRMGRSADPTPNDGTYQWTDKLGQIHTLPNGVDPGWDYAPGRGRIEDRKKVLQNSLSRLSPSLQAMVKQDYPSI